MKWKSRECYEDIYQGTIFWIEAPLFEEVMLMLRTERRERASKVKW